MTQQAQHPGRISQCIEKSLAQLNNRDEIFYYDITKKDLFIWSACPLCDSKETRRIAEVYLKKELLFFTTDICEKCFHIFRGISPSAEWFMARWKQIATGELCVYNPALEEKRKIRYELYYGLLHKYKSRGLLLDIGAAYGSGTNVFLERGFIAEALEPEQDRADYIREVCQIPVFHETIEDFKAEKNKYDAILFAHCLEHLNDPIAALKKLRDCLRPDGVLYVEIPIVWKVVDWQDALFMAHKHNFVEKNLKAIMAKVGFNIIDSYMIPDNDGPFCNLAFVAVKKTHPDLGDFDWPGLEAKLFDPKRFNIDDLIKLYRIQLPVKNVSGDVLKYDVPYINHFYHILRNDRTQCQLKDGYLSYQDEGK